MIEKGNLPVGDDRIQHVLPSCAGDRSPIDHGNNTVTLNPDPEVTFRVIRDLIRRRMQGKNTFVLQRGFTPLALLLEDEKIDAEVFWVRAVFCKRPSSLLPSASPV
jgi:hypothetical protein